MPAHRGTASSPIYSEEQRKAAVTAALMANREHPYSDVSLEAIETVLGAKISKGALQNWMKDLRSEIEGTLNKTPPSDSVMRVRDETIQRWAAVETAYIDRLLAEDTISKANAGQAALTAGLAHDKIAKATAIGLEVEQKVRAIQTKCATLHWDLLDTLADVVKMLDAEIALVEAERARKAGYVTVNEQHQIGGGSHA